MRSTHRGVLIYTAAGSKGCDGIRGERTQHSATMAWGKAIGVIGLLTKSAPLEADPKRGWTRFVLWTHALRRISRFGK